MIATADLFDRATVRLAALGFTHVTDLPKHAARRWRDAIRAERRGLNAMSAALHRDAWQAKADECRREVRSALAWAIYHAERADSLGSHEACSERYAEILAELDPPR